MEQCRHTASRAAMMLQSAVAFIKACDSLIESKPSACTIVLRTLSFTGGLGEAVQKLTEALGGMSLHSLDFAVIAVDSVMDRHQDRDASDPVVHAIYGNTSECACVGAKAAPTTANMSSPWPAPVQIVADQFPDGVWQAPPFYVGSENPHWAAYPRRRAPRRRSRRHQ